MSLAAHNPAAQSAPRRAGGQHHPATPRTKATRRRSARNGGDIKSLCCEAAGIIQPNPASTAGAYTPPPGVRRAAHLLPRCAHPTRLHAQLAEGYGHHLKGASA